MTLANQHMTLADQHTTFANRRITLASFGAFSYKGINNVYTFCSHMKLAKNPRGMVK